MGIDDTLAEEIIRRVLQVLPARKIILFGSAATGTMTKDSDIDLLVLTNGPCNRRELGLDIEESLTGLGHCFDIMVLTAEWFENSKKYIGGLAYPAHRYGRVLYEAA
ncbi:MAG: hypothetical protein A2284_18265 [Deltaproteobacteria bacterium RIFOXYA12_FULL_61_11]|nr:MAG: hypothetical protein A2284_18265 [Deltaproteobacteria bacterium RIFOXYA12_FULL_61_11]